MWGVCEYESEGGGDGFWECLWWSSVAGVQDSPGLGVGDDSFVSFSRAVWLSRVAVVGKTLRPSFVYEIFMGEYLPHGRRVSDEQIQAWADEAEAGYDLQQPPCPTPGRPPVGRGPGTVVTVRLDEELLAALLKRAADEGITNRSEVVRAAVKQWAHVAA